MRFYQRVQLSKVYNDDNTFRPTNKLLTSGNIFTPNKPSKFQIRDPVTDAANIVYNNPTYPTVFTS